MEVSVKRESSAADTETTPLYRFVIPRSVFFAWLLHLIISLVFGLTLQNNPEAIEAPWFSTPDWAGNLAHWDVNWEIRITDQGYGPDFSPQTSAKFPLASLFARLIHQLMGLPIQVALFIVNKAALLAGLWALWRLVVRLYDVTTADRAVRYMAFPLLGTAFIYWMSYPDVLFLAWWALAFTGLFEGRYLRAGLLATLAVWTRPQGALLIGVFGLSILIGAVKTASPPGPLSVYREGESKWSMFIYGGLYRLLTALRTRAFWQKVGAACLIPALGLAGWVIRVSDETGIPFSPYVAQAEVGRADLMWPWERIVERVGWMTSQGEPLNAGRWVEGWQLLLIVAGLLVMLVACWRGKLRWELLVFSALSIGLPLATAIMAIGRFATLTWLPLMFIYIIPARGRWLDGLLWLVGIGLAVAVLANINLTPSDWYYVP